MPTPPDDFARYRVNSFEGDYGSRVYFVERRLSPSPLLGRERWREIRNTRSNSEAWAIEKARELVKGDAAKTAGKFRPVYVHDDGIVVRSAGTLYE